MAKLMDIDRRLPGSIPTLRIYRERCVLNASACELLGIPLISNRVYFRQDMDEASLGRDRIYVCRSDSLTGHEVKMRHLSGRINSASLSRKLAGHLQGFGAYRICKEVTIAEGKNTYYEIFFRRYE